MIHPKSILVLSLLLFSCKSTSEFTGFSYDPPGVTNTTGKEIKEQNRRIIGAGNPKVWVSNEFEGARASDFYQINGNTFEVLIEPENYPINNSPWFSFYIWGEEARAINLRIAFKEGKHRYKPKIERSMGVLSYSHIVENADFDSISGTTTFGIHLEEQAQRVSAHLFDNIRFTDLINTFSVLETSNVDIDTAGFSNENRPVIALTVDESTTEKEKGVLVLLSRQHPPEVSGYRTYQHFFETLISNSELAREFRSKFIIKAFPIINPDGVVNGHWRHNGAGVDLNRDWQNFNQPETQAVRDALLDMKNASNARIYYGIDFHSTNENIFYPILEEIETSPDNLTQRWFQQVDSEHPELNFVSEEFDTSSPISKNWFYRTFGSDALTFEVHDELPLDDIRKLGVNSANSLMELLLEEWQNANPN